MIKNIELANNVLECTKTLQNICFEMYQLAGNSDYPSFVTVANETLSMLDEIGKVFDNLTTKENEFAITRISLVDNAIHSLKQILLYEKTRSQKLFMKLEFELLPIIDELHADFYYLAFIKGDDEKIRNYNENEWKFLRSSRYIEESIKTGIYKYDVSIMITGYNKLEYTKHCVESVIKNTPSYINYELIFINHGSSDGTKEYFESIGCTKQADFLNNGGSAAILRVLEGKYACMISNDVIVGANYLDNMIKCIESDEKILWVVPTTTNISNRQTIPVPFDEFKAETEIAETEIYDFASKNNVSDPYRWEQRFKLCNPIELLRTADMISSTGIGKYIRNFWTFGFGDDVASSIVRRSGGKCILAKDTFCYHFGSVTISDDKAYNTKQNFINGRKKFKNYFGIDSWGKGSTFNPTLCEKLIYQNNNHVDILGINCGFGSDPLKIREELKEQSHNLDVTIYNATDEEEYLQDVKCISDEVSYITDKNEMLNAFSEKSFDYIIFEEDFKLQPDPTAATTKLLSRLKSGGQLAIIDYNNLYGEKVFKKLAPDLILIEEYPEDFQVQAGTWYIWHKNA